MISGQQQPADTSFVAVSRDDRAVLQGDWKLVVTGNLRELYNLAADPYEKINLAADHPQVVENLQAVLRNIPQQPSINQSLLEVMMDMDRFGGEEDRAPWADTYTR